MHTHVKIVRKLLLCFAYGDCPPGWRWLQPILFDKVSQILKMVLATTHSQMLKTYKVFLGKGSQVSAQLVKYLLINGLVPFSYIMLETKRQI